MSDDYRAGLHLIPEHMHPSVTLWIERGEPSPRLHGRFLHAVFTNRLLASFMYADDENLNAMRGWATFIYAHAPPECHGSDEALEEWYRLHHETTIPAPAADAVVP